MAVKPIDVLCDRVPCTSSNNRRFGEHIASIFRVQEGDKISQIVIVE
jgi:hypothetical protein